jgi:hypothetical protein
VQQVQYQMVTMRPEMTDVNEYIRKSEEKGTWILSACVVEEGDLIYVDSSQIVFGEIAVAREISRYAGIVIVKHNRVFSHRFLLKTKYGEFWTIYFDLADDIETKTIPGQIRFSYDWRGEKFFGGRPKIREW